ncbi:MAG: hypothetical protein Q7I97_02585 [Thermovirgaceae bacterium]|nr:hypothetical protein [Thermovirgaceae bacterium]
MASRDSWLGSAQDLWRDITEGDRFPRFVRISLAIVMTLGTLWSAFLFRQMFSTMRGSDMAPPADNATTDQEIAQLEETARGFRNAVMARTGSTQLAVLAATVARKPFMPSDAAGSRADLLDEMTGTPMMWVKAVLIKGNDAAAVVDVDGYGEGIILKKGGSFAGGKGRVVAITHDKVVVTWSGQQIDIPVDR